ncbi:hypothetical protein ELI13_10875 [Rhizobium ruizarguesonis]|uniref:Uncharacterized protein n=1 Tax=Rhizobium ruizarguesonis TaxID=2081791 RepID=A0AAE8QE95_9HYPH|nr:hypothetical protein [Rhizobium leguminosarum bv. viciae]NKQ75316.1 hypothetical protein [Rhizobium ruizarguesonis]NKL28656.1 hypothetical protein [Rhizobium leguminosarum bv. viciae]NKL46107.1 hypothetical protein [Rhizobium leguminosarum bv. viciae]NKQ80192.1 hypothetical protein [Rhizobium ruizarguesonis]
MNEEKPGSPGFLLTGLALFSTSFSALCRRSAVPAADARDKPEHDERGVGRLVSSPADRRAFVIVHPHQPLRCWPERCADWRRRRLAP